MPMDRRRGWTLVLTSLGLTLLGGLLVAIGLFAGRGGGLVLVLTGYLLLLFGYIVFAVWYGMQNRDMDRLTPEPFNTILWVILLFVPIANVVSLYKFSDHIHEAQSARGVTGVHPVVLFLLMWLVSVVGLPMAQAQMDKLG